jgi:hypothetical protein
MARGSPRHRTVIKRIYARMCRDCLLKTRELLHDEERLTTSTNVQAALQRHQAIITAVLREKAVVMARRHPTRG